MTRIRWIYADLFWLAEFRSERGGDLARARTARGRGRALRAGDLAKGRERDLRKAQPATVPRFV